MNTVLYIERGGRGGCFQRGRSGVRAKSAFLLKAMSPYGDFLNNPEKGAIAPPDHRLDVGTPPPLRGNRASRTGWIRQ